MRRSSCFLWAALALASATTACMPPEDATYGQAPSLLNPGGGSLLSGAGPTGAPAGRGVTLLAPLTGPNAERADALVKAAQLALAEPGSPRLDVRDTGGTPAGAAAAAQAAIAGGAGLIIGPLSAAETAAVAGPAATANVAVLAFTNDAAQGRPGVWPLGLTAAQQVHRLVTAATGQGKSRFAAVLPDTDFGHAMGTALTQAVGESGAEATDIRFHGDGNAAIASTMRDVSGYQSRRGPIDAQIKAARQAHDAAGRRAAADLSRRAIPPPPFDALLLADTGGKLSWLTSFLSYYDIDPPAVRVMGPALWSNPAQRADAAVEGAWYAAPDPAARAGFDQAYTAKYGSPAPALADFAYDAAAIARELAKAGDFSAAALTRPAGFAGVDGVLVLQPDGSVRRGLALWEIQHGSAAMVEPAPAGVPAPGT